MVLKGLLATALITPTIPDLFIAASALTQQIILSALEPTGRPKAVSATVIASSIDEFKLSP